MEILNKAQVDVLFQREAVLLGTADGVPKFRVVSLFGEDAAKHVTSLSGGGYMNGYGIGDYTLMFVTYRSFQVAASFYNAQQLRRYDEAIE